MSRRSGVVLLVSASLGCGGRPQGDEIVPLDRVPAVVLEAARKELPGIRFDTAFKIKHDGMDAYEVRGKNAQGKVREVEVSRTGEVLEVE